MKRKRNVLNTIESIRIIGSITNDIHQMKKEQHKTSKIIYTYNKRDAIKFCIANRFQQNN